MPTRTKNAARRRAERRRHKRHADHVKPVLLKTDRGYLWGLKCWRCDVMIHPPIYEAREDVPAHDAG